MSSGVGEWELVGPSKKTKTSSAGNDDEKSKIKSAKSTKSVEKPLPSAKDANKNLQKFKLGKSTEKKEDDYDDDFTFKTEIKPNHKTTSKKTVPAKPKTLKDAIAKLNLSEVQNLSKTLRKQYLATPIVWLKDLASFLNVKLNPSTPVDSAYRQESVCIAPLDYLALPIREFLVAVIQNTSLDVLSEFHRHCFTSMLHESMRGLPVHGYAIFVQVMGNVCRDACVLCFEDYIPLREMYDKHPRSGLTYVWLLSHTIATAVSGKHYSAAVKMWMEGLVPLLGSKHYSTLVASCGKEMSSKILSLLNSNETPQYKNNPNGNGKTVIVSAEQLLTLLDITYSSNTQIPRPINKQLIDIFNKLRVVCTLPSLPGANKESVTLLQRVLPKLSQTTTAAFAQQIITIFANCLECSEANCLTAWSEMLQRHYLQSTKMMRLLCNDDEYCRVLATVNANKMLKIFDKQTSSIVDDIQAKELNREVKKVLSNLPVGSCGRNSKDGKNNSDLNGRSWIGYFFRVIFWVIIISTSIAYYTVSLDNNKADFEKYAVGKVATALGVKREVQLAVHNIAVFSNSTADSAKLWSMHTMEVIKPYADVVQTKYIGALDWISAQIPWVTEKLSVVYVQTKETLSPLLDVLCAKLSPALESVRNLFKK